jgi:hypothetical protein
MSVYTYYMPDIYCDMYAVGLRDQRSQQRKNALLGNGWPRNNGRNCCFLWGLFRGNNGLTQQCVLSLESDPRLYNHGKGLDVVGGLVPLRIEEGRPKAVRDKVAGKG